LNDQIRDYVRNALEHTEANRNIVDKLTSANQSILKLISQNKNFQERISEFEKQSRVIEFFN